MMMHRCIPCYGVLEVFIIYLVIMTRAIDWAARGMHK